MPRVDCRHGMGNLQSTPILAQLSKKYGQNGHDVHGWERTFCVLLDGYAPPIYMVAVSSGRICTFRRRVEWNVLHLECRVDKLDNQMVYTQVRRAQGLPKSMSILLWAGAWRLRHWLCVEHHRTYFQHASL